MILLLLIGAAYAQSCPFQRYDRGFLGNFSSPNFEQFSITPNGEYLATSSLGLVTVFKREFNTWTMVGKSFGSAYNQTKFTDFSPFALDISNNGQRVAVSIMDQCNAFEWNGTAWTQLGQTINVNIPSGDYNYPWIELNSIGDRMALRNLTSIETYNLVGQTWIYTASVEMPLISTSTRQHALSDDGLTLYTIVGGNFMIYEFVNGTWSLSETISGSYINFAISNNYIALMQSSNIRIYFLNATLFKTLTFVSSNFIGLSDQYLSFQKSNATYSEINVVKFNVPVVEVSTIYPIRTNLCGGSNLLSQFGVFSKIDSSNRVFIRDTRATNINGGCGNVWVFSQCADQNECTIDSCDGNSLCQHQSTCQNCVVNHLYYAQTSAKFYASTPRTYDNWICDEAVVRKTLVGPIYYMSLSAGTNVWLQAYQRYQAALTNFFNNETNLCLTCGQTQRLDYWGTSEIESCMNFLRVSLQTAYPTTAKKPFPSCKTGTSFNRTVNLTRVNECTTLIGQFVDGNTDLPDCAFAVNVVQSEIEDPSLTLEEELSITMTVFVIIGSLSLLAIAIFIGVKFCGHQTTVAGAINSPASIPLKKMFRYE